MYTLNYDRLFKVLAERIGISVFEGFDCGEYITDRETLPNIKRILTDSDSNIHYNLHGSAFWNIHPRDEKNQLLSPYVALHAYPQLNINNSENSVLQIEKGRNILISNIITGFHKSAKIIVPPFKQMQSAFDNDCCITDELIIVGYSLGDSHINQSIKTALKYNPKLKIHLVDPIYYEKDGKKGYELLIERLLDVFPEIFNFEQTTLKHSNDRNTTEYYSGKLTVSAFGFEEFLKK